MYGIYRTQTIHCISVFNGINFALKRSRFLNYASFQTFVRNIPNNTSAIARDASQKHLLYRLPSHWLAIWRIFRRSPLSEEKYPNRNPAWKQALLIIDFQWFTKKKVLVPLSPPYPILYITDSPKPLRTLSLRHWHKQLSTYHWVDP